MARAGLFVNEFNLTEEEWTKVSQFIGMINDSRAKNDKPSIHPDEACKFLFARNFDLSGSVELARNYEKYYADYDIASVSNDTKQIEAAWYTRKIWHTERRDKDGAAIMFFESGLTDTGKDHKSIVQTLFLTLEDAAKSKKTQRNGIIILMDLHDITLTNVDHGLMKLIFKIVLEVFPLLVKFLYLIDVPLWFKLKQKVVEHFLTPQVRHKIKLVSRIELTKLLPAQSVPSTLGGTEDGSLQNLNWLNVMAEGKQGPPTKVRNSFQSGKLLDETTDKRVPIVPRGYQNPKKNSETKAHPFATATTSKTDKSSVSPARSAQAAVDKRQQVSKPFIPPPVSVSKNNNALASSIASRISNWEGRSFVNKPPSDKPVNGPSKITKQSSNISQNSSKANGSGNTSKITADRVAQFSPSETLRINWTPDHRDRQKSVCSIEGDYIKDWISGKPQPEYQNVDIDKLKSPLPGNAPNQTKQPARHEKFSLPDNSSNGAYEIINYGATAKPLVKPHAPNRRPMVVGSAKTLKLNHDYVNVDIPSDPEPPPPPPVPSKKKKPPIKATVVNDQSDDSELDEEEGNEAQYENWSFLNPHEGDQNMTISELDAYVKSRKLQGLKAEYFKIRNKPDSSEMNICRLPCNIKKNRYRDVGCLDRNRVKLNKVQGKEGSDYIHGNYADGYKTSKEYILTQGPLKGTVVDFWRMIWEQKAMVIVMLTRCMELNRWKCSQYWPDSGSMVYGDVHVELLHSEEVHSFTVRTLCVHHVNDEGRKHTINQFQFTSWPDYGVPSSGMDILFLIESVKDHQAALLAKCPSSIGQFPPHGPPIVVHCSAGVGRTGSFCAVDYCTQQWLDTKKVNIQACVKLLRSQRAYSIQTEDQYHFCYKCVLEFAKNLA